MQQNPNNVLVNSNKITQNFCEITDRIHDATGYIMNVSTINLHTIKKTPYKNQLHFM